MTTKTFDFSGAALRVFTIGGEPWFLAADVRRILGVKQAGTNFAFLGKDEVAPLPRGLATGKGLTTALILSESGLYKFVLRSDKLEARAFQDWVTREVLPSIRKTGGYLLNEEARDTAKADDRQAMPLPEQFAQVLQMLATVTAAQAETQALLTKLLTKRSQQPVNRDERMMSAKEAKAAMDLPGTTQEIGIRLWDFCHQNGVAVLRPQKGQMGVNRYPAWAFKASFATA